MAYRLINRGEKPSILRIPGNLRKAFSAKR